MKTKEERSKNYEKNEKRMKAMKKSSEKRRKALRKNEKRSRNYDEE